MNFMLNTFMIQKKNNENIEMKSHTIRAIRLLGYQHCRSHVSSVARVAIALCMEGLILFILTSSILMEMHLKIINIMNILSLLFYNVLIICKYIHILMKKIFITQLHYLIVFIYFTRIYGLTYLIL